MSGADREPVAARHAHALLAAALAEPALLERWRDDPGACAAACAAAGVAPADLDVEGLRHFAGFVTMVRHHPLRARCPLMFRTLAALDLELPMFADYAAPFAELRRAGPLDDGTRHAALLDFMGGWLDLDDPDEALVWDVARHEAALAALRTDPAALDAAGRASAAAGAPPLTAGDTPVLSAALRLAELSCDPAQVRVALDAAGTAAPAEALAGLERGTCWFAYRVGADGALAVHRLDDVTGFLLGQVDGVRTLAAIAQAVGDLTGEPLDGDQLAAALAPATARGWIERAGPGGAARCT